ncbi:MAG TPA: HAMP domain-containing sensor histidine kinase [Jatrophihabitantaceae bacterium]|jgi:signal transduction histidine kinase|nr:HAMP domain-containing sensor histidine kinase [Jatrophihabitantaceae bacterium]
MTRRILAGFLGVLVAVLAAIVVPLGLLVSTQQRDDFRDATRTAARAVAAVAEERLDDHQPAALATALAKLAAAGERIAVLDAAGNVIGRAGPPLPAAVLVAARTNRPLPPVAGSMVTTATVGDAAPIGVVVLARDTDPLTDRQQSLWTWLGVAAVAALLVGAVVAWALSRWIARPLRQLAGVAGRLGSGDTAARAEPDRGPPQVRLVAAAFNRMADQVLTLIETQRGMTAEVSHQLRTPLAALRLRLELLGADLHGDDAAEVTGLIEETNRLSRLLDGLLAVARAENAPSVPEPVDLAAIAAERVAAWQPLAAERGVVLRLDTEQAVGLATSGHVEQILDNLLDNAIAAVPSQGRITVATSRRDSKAVLSIADNGPGMAADRRTRTLDRFVTDRTGDGGTGLGLHVVNRLVSSDAGTISLTETPGGGLTVAIAFPLDPSPAHDGG